MIPYLFELPMYLYNTSAIILTAIMFTLVNLFFFFYSLPFPESPDCYFEDGSCGWAGEEDWETKIFKENSKDNLLVLSNICDMWVSVKKRGKFHLFHFVPKGKGN